MESSTLQPEQKAAAVIVALGAEKASKLYKHLNESEIEKLTIEVAKLGHISSEETEAVLDEFYKTCLTQKVVTDGGMEYARAVLEKAFGESTAQNLLDKLAKSLKTRPFEFIRKSTVKTLFSFLQHERPQTIALVLSYAEPDQAATVISELPKEKRIKVVEAVAKMESVSPDAIKIVESSLKKKFENILTTDFTTIGGIDYVADVMKNISLMNLAKKMKNWQKQFVRRCSYSKILYQWTTDLFRDLYVNVTLRILYMH